MLPVEGFIENNVHIFGSLNNNLLMGKVLGLYEVYVHYTSASNPHTWTDTRSVEIPDDEYQALVARFRDFTESYRDITSTLFDCLAEDDLVSIQKIFQRSAAWPDDDTGTRIALWQRGQRMAQAWKHRFGPLPDHLELYLELDPPTSVKVETPDRVDNDVAFERS